MKDERQFIEYERPDWPPEPSTPPFKLHRMDIPQPKQEKGGLGVLVAAIGMLACVVGAIGWTLWSAL